MQTLAKRIDALEQSNRRLRVGGGVYVTLLVGMLILGADEPTQKQLTQKDADAMVYDTIRARKIEIVGDNDKDAITLFIDSGGLGAVMSITGPSGSVTMIRNSSILMLSGGGSVHILSGELPSIMISGSSRGSMTIGDDGIVMYDEKLVASEVVTRPLLSPRLQRRLDRQKVLANIKEFLEDQE
ncbi:MAG: hypothetical protein IID37_15450 [Planctomycetes bacterium]|nr:hypothetical protein [Planctomycetota bacterium]